MKVVVDIPESMYKYYITHIDSGELKVEEDILGRLLNNGIVLPKGHGDLIDKDRLLYDLDKTVKSVDDTNKHLLFWDRAVAHVHLSKPIIEADKGE